MALRRPPAGAVLSRGREAFLALKDGASIVLVNTRHGPAVAPPPVPLRALFDRASVLMPEFDFTDPSRKAAASEHLRHGGAMATHRFLDAQEMATVHAAWTKKLNGKASMPVAMLGEMHACALSMFLLPSVGPAPDAHRPPRLPPWEHTFLVDAKSAGKAVVELEPAGEFSICGQLQPAQVRDLLLEAAKLELHGVGLADYVRLQQASVRSAERGDGRASYAHMLEAVGFSARYRSAFVSFLSLRNHAMAAVLLAQHRRLTSGGLVFSLPGGLHLHGDMGLLNLLGQRGFAITRVQY